MLSDQQLKELIIDAELIPQEEVNDAVATAEQAHRPLDRVLIERDIISD